MDQMDQGIIWRFDEERLKYKETAKRLKKINGFLLLVVVALLFVAMVDWHEAYKHLDENATLKQQVTEWRQAAEVAMEIRGWRDKIPTDQLYPGHLVNAMNPCRLAPEGENAVMKDCQHAIDPFLQPHGKWYLDGFPYNHVEFVLK